MCREGRGSQSPSYVHCAKGTHAVRLCVLHMPTCHVLCSKAALCVFTKATIYYLLVEANSITT